MIFGRSDLEGEPCAQFHNAIAVSDIATLIVGARDASKGRGGQAYAGIAEVWSVGHAKCFSSELESHPLPNREIAEDSSIEIKESRAGELVAPHVAQYAIGDDWAIWGLWVQGWGRLTKGRRIEPKVGVDAPQHVERRDLNRILRRSRCIEVISVCGEVKRGTAHPGQDAGHTPSA